jgi:two-component system, NarL family, nitrate/nitrite response regulator NarL
MPVLNGFDAAREIRKILPEAKILMLAMHESKQLVEEAKRIGVHGYVTKTQASETLLRAVDTLLSKHLFYPEPA